MATETLDTFTDTQSRFQMQLIKHEYIGYSTPDGGNLHVVDGLAPEIGRVGNYGVGFGPLRLTPWADSTVVIDDLEFTQADAGWFNVLSAGGATAAATLAASSTDDPIDPDRLETSRRSLLLAAGVGLATLGVGAGVASADDEDRHNVATFDLETNPRGLNIAVDDLVAEYLPADHEFFVDVNGTAQGSFKAGEESLTINPGIEGEVEVQSDDALSFVQRVIANYTAEDELEYSFNPVDEPFSEQTVGDTIQLSEQPVLVDPIEFVDPSEVAIDINDTAIPHADNGTSEKGNWWIRDGRELVYDVGEDSPDSTLVEVRINIGRLERFRRRL